MTTGFFKYFTRLSSTGESNIKSQNHYITFELAATSFIFIYCKRIILVTYERTNITFISFHS